MPQSLSIEKLAAALILLVDRHPKGEGDRNKLQDILNRTSGLEDIIITETTFDAAVKYCVDHAYITGGQVIGNRRTFFGKITAAGRDFAYRNLPGTPSNDSPN